MGFTLRLLGSITLLAFFSSGDSTWVHPSWVYTSALTPGYSPWCTPSDALQTPSRVRDIQSIIQRAFWSGKKVKALGARHSVTDILCTDGIPISMEKFQQMTLNHDKTATFGAGVHLVDALAFLQSKGRTLIQVPGFLGITIGGAMGSGAHGSSAIHPSSISQLATKLTIVDGLGKTHTIQGHELNTFRIHLGLLGVITSVTLATVPTFKMLTDIVTAPDIILTNGTILDWAQKYDFVQLSWHPNLGMVGVVRGTNVDASTAGNAGIYVTLYANTTAASAYQTMQFFDFIQATRNYPALAAIQQNGILTGARLIENGVTVPSPAVGYHYQLTAGDCNGDCVWDFGNYSFQGEETTMAVDLEELPKIVPTIRGILAQIPTTWPLSGIALRFHSKSDAVLSMAHKKTSVIIDIIYPTRIDPNTPKTSLASYQAIFQALIEKHGARPHWAKGGEYYHSHGVISKAVPHDDLWKFKQAMLKYDPSGVFHNKFSRRFWGTGSASDVRPDVTRCALRDSCKCSKDGDCGDNQVCGDVLDVDGTHTYKVCKELLAYTNKPLGQYNPYDINSIIYAILYG